MTDPVAGRPAEASAFAGRRIVDLTMTIEPHFRWSVERRVTGDLDRGDPFQVTWLGWTVHGFTHIDAPRHMVPGGPTTSDFRLDGLVGAAAVLDLGDHAGPDTAIDAAALDRAGDGVERTPIVLVRTGWDRRRSAHTPAFWTEAPFLTRDACEWLLDRGPRTVGFDFPQDYPIRGLLDGRTAPMADFVSHDVLLRNGVVMIEYLCNLWQVDGPRVDLVALPLKVEDADGAPARVIAIEAGNRGRSRKAGPVGSQR